MSPVSCDVVDVDGNPIPKDREVPTYAHAQKMRAAMTYAFGRIQRLGSVPWQESVSGHTTGNPSVSEIVSSYMVSLRRRKVLIMPSCGLQPGIHILFQVQAGESAVSSRAITPVHTFSLINADRHDVAQDIILQLYNFNNSEGRSTIQYRHPNSWCGPRTRLMIHAACTVALACLLRFDEVLRIQISDIEFLLDKHGERTQVKLMLRSRKTSQFGGVYPTSESTPFMGYLDLQASNRFTCIYFPSTSRTCARLGPSAVGSRRPE